MELVSLVKNVILAKLMKISMNKFVKLLQLAVTSMKLMKLIKEPSKGIVAI